MRSHGMKTKIGFGFLGKNREYSYIYQAIISSYPNCDTDIYYIGRKADTGILDSGNIVVCTAVESMK